MNRLLRDSAFDSNYDKELGNFTIENKQGRLLYKSGNYLIARVLRIRNKISHLVIYDTSPDLVQKFIVTYGIVYYSYIFKTRNTNCTQYDYIIRPFTYAFNREISLYCYKLPASFAFDDYYKKSVFNKNVIIIESMYECKNITCGIKYTKARFAILVNMHVDCAYGYDWLVYTDNIFNNVKIRKLLNFFELVFIKSCIFKLVDGKILCEYIKGLHYRRNYNYIIPHETYYQVAKILICEERRYANTKSAFVN